VMIYTVENAMVFLLGWEIAALAAWLLVIWDYRNQKIRFAGFNYLVSTHIGLLFLIAAFLVLYSSAGTWDFSGFQKILSVSSERRDVTFLLLVTSFGLKSAFFPFHTWLPRAHSAAPAHVSALMSGVIHKAGLFALLKFLLMIGTPEPWMGWYLVGFSALSMFGGVLYTVAQRDLKRLLGYSSTENVGIAGIGFGIGSLGLAWGNPTLVALGFTGGILHVLNHALFKCLLFYGAGAIYRQTHTVDIEHLGGLARKMPSTAVLFLIGSLAIAALPPFNGFVSEFLLYSGLFEGSLPAGTATLALSGVAALLALVGGISALSVTRAFGVVFLGAPRDPEHVAHGDVGAAMRVPMLLHAAGAVLLGLVPSLGVAIASAPASMFGGDAAIPLASAGTVQRVVLLIAAGGAAVALLRWTLPGRVRRFGTWGCGYTAPSPRMQYSGFSFSDPFAQIFAPLLPHLHRGGAPEGPFPLASSMQTHCVDAVEHRMFEVIGNGERTVKTISARMTESARFGFALTLVTIVAGILLILLSEGP
ncbi:MAG TPA: proton-conducting transporter membrane subunit, partial [bacterium]|nr:proton-conducting transporter membrane subunit [bacterium]